MQNRGIIIALALCLCAGSMHQCATTRTMAGGTTDTETGGVVAAGTTAVSDSGTPENLAKTQDSVKDSLASDTTAGLQVAQTAAPTDPGVQIARGSLLRISAGAIGLAGLGASTYFNGEVQAKYRDYQTRSDPEELGQLHRDIRKSEINRNVFGILGTLGILSLGVSFAF